MSVKPLAIANCSQKFAKIIRGTIRRTRGSMRPARYFVSCDTVPRSASPSHRSRLGWTAKKPGRPEEGCHVSLRQHHIWGRDRRPNARCGVKRENTRRRSIATVRFDDTTSCGVTDDQTRDVALNANMPATPTIIVFHLENTTSCGTINHQTRDVALSAKTRCFPLRYGCAARRHAPSLP